MDISIIQYLFESSIALLSFYLLYYWGLRNETFFQLNRWYLLLMPALALSIPLIDVEMSTAVAEAGLPIFYPVIEEYHAWQEIAWSPEVQSKDSLWQISLGDVLYWGYWLGFLLMSIKLLHGLRVLTNEMRKARAKKAGKVVYLETEQERPTASFFSYIFWNANTKAKDEKYQLILEHEMVHVRQRHSVDVLLMELWVIVKWFNPIIYLYRRHLRLTHEYIADQFVVEQTGNRLAYAELMVESESEITTNRLTHKFNSLTKMRLIMLARSKSNRWRYARYFLILPIALSLFALFSFNVAATLPDEVLQPFEKAENLLREFADKELILLPTERPVVKLKWGEKLCDCKPEKYKNVFRCENLSFSPRAYKRFVRKWDNFQLFEKDKNLDVEELRIISNRMVDMGGFMGQFDESGQIDKESPLWKKPKFGDVYKFEFKGGGDKWFSFEVVINNRKEELEPAYFVDLGTYSFSIDMTSKIGVRHFNFVDFQRAINQPFILQNNDGESLAISKVTIRNAAAYLTETLEKVGKTAIDLSQLKLIQEAIAGDQIAMTIWTEEGQELRVDMMIRKNASSQVFNREVELLWGDQRFPMEPFSTLVLKEEEVKSLRGKSLKLRVNDAISEVESAKITIYHKNDGNPIIGKTEEKTLSPKEFDDRLASLAAGDSFFARMKTNDDRLFYFTIHLEKEVDWKAVLKDKGEFTIQAGTGTVFIRKISPEALTAIAEVRYHTRAPGFTIAKKEENNLALPLFDLPKHLTSDQIDYIKIVPPSAQRQNERRSMYLGQATVYLK
ncbi:MAG: M56 family metallopeptidase [Saprospiraceae bacterium]|nr:M56 family metallopeptidase [Saprospiraceae bacterium]